MVIRHSSAESALHHDAADVIVAAPGECLVRQLFGSFLRIDHILQHHHWTSRTLDTHNSVFSHKSKLKSMSQFQFDGIVVTQITSEGLESSYEGTDRFNEVRKGWTWY